MQLDTQSRHCEVSAIGRMSQKREFLALIQATELILSE